jgi:UDP-N-acetylmuramoyl-tripeptide--D-alanyl-D-alanine ligase
MNLTLSQVAKMCGGELSPGSNADIPILRCIIDSREACANDLFVAIKGENHDAHDFVMKIINAIGGAIVAKDFVPNLPNLIRVTDTTYALGLLASNYRQLFSLPVVALTGSNGKTTVKEMLKNICDVQFGEKHVLATTGNLNNHWGMPLTLLKLGQQHQVAILEMGMNHSGELNYLSSLAKPTVAVVNNAMWAHAGFFKDLADIAKAKGEIYNGLLPNGVACVNMSDNFGTYWEELALNLGQGVRIYRYGTKDSNVYIAKHDDSGNLEIVTPLGLIKTKLQVLGEHNYANALTAVTVALNLNCSLENIGKGLASFSGYRRRLERKRAFNGAVIIDDSYNANPDSVKAAVTAIKNLPKPHWFILGDLGELGEFTHKLHHELGEFIGVQHIDKLLTVGELAKIASNSFVGDKLHFLTNQEMIAYCLTHLPTSATLLIKGSNSTKLSDVVDQLTLNNQNG